MRIDKIHQGGNFPAWRGLFFDPAAWDGSDLFMSANGAGWIFVVDAVKSAFEKAKITNAQFEALDLIDRSELELKMLP